jgi:penicillin-binding protein 2B
MANTYKKLRQKTFMISSLLILLWSVLIGRLFYIQVLNSKKYQALCNSQANLRKEVLPIRGTIYDRNGKALTVDLVSYSIAAHPYLIRDKAALARELAAILVKNMKSIKHCLNPVRRSSGWNAKCLTSAF